MCISSPFRCSQSKSFASAIDALPKKSLTVSKRPHLVVHHNYHDRSAERREIDPEDWMRIKASNNSPFPIRLYHMLDRVERDGFEHIVSWQRHGRCFVIHKLDKFTAELLPRYMKLAKLTSFQRQLNLYGFNRITQGIDKGGYYHEYLLRGKGPLSLQIQRLKVKGTGVRAKSNPAEEPDFWAMPWMTSHGDDADLSSTTSHQAKPYQPLHPNTVAALAKAPNQSFSSELRKPFRQNHEGSKTPQLPQQNCTTLTKWGMPFQVMYDLPEEIQPLQIWEDSATLIKDNDEQKDKNLQYTAKDCEPLPLQGVNEISFEDGDFLDMLECIRSMS